MAKQPDRRRSRILLSQGRRRPSRRECRCEARIRAAARLEPLRLLWTWWADVFAVGILWPAAGSRAVLVLSGSLCGPAVQPESDPPSHIESEGRLRKGSS